ncbi:MAG: DNA cytosine methyltransferase [Sulfolobaceae archaeon]
MKRPVVVDLFAGAGGFSLGFKLESYEVAVAVDIDSAAVRTYSVNFPTTIVLQEDIKYLSSSDIMEVLKNRTPDVVIGSPPCEPFTGANPNRFENEIDRLYLDPKGNLTLEFIRLVGELKPKVFVMENVPSLVSSKNLRNALITEFRKIGYDKIYFNILRAENFGNPSRRTRVFISNIKLDLNEFKVKKIKKVWDVLYDLEFKFDLPNHNISEINERKLNKISKLKYGDYLTMYKGSSGRNIPLYIRLDPNDIAPTVMGNSRFIHPFHDRFLTVREQARLMSFPDTHIFLGSKDEQYNQVGEAVPVVLSRVIAKKIKGILLGNSS